MKKLLSICLSVFLLLSSLPFVVQAAEWTGTGAENVTFSFGLVGDTHTGSNENTVAQSVQAAVDLGADFIAFSGDLTAAPSTTGDGGNESFYDAYYEAFKPTLTTLTESGIEYSSAMGNHEFAGTMATDSIAIAAWERYMGPGNTHIVSDQGFHFISARPENYELEYSDETVNYMITEIEKAIAEDSTNDVDGAFAEGVVPDSIKPVFAVVHYISPTLEALYDYLKTRPQVILLSGHTHPLAEHPLSITQEGYTSYVGPVGYGNANAYDTESYKSPKQSTFIQVENDSVVKIYKLDLAGKTFIGDPWTIDVGAIVSDLSDDDATNDLDNFLYSADKRANPSVPYFEEDATFKAEPVFTAAKLIFPNALNDGTPNQQDDYVVSYDVYVYDAQGTEVYTTRIMPDFVNNKTVPSSYSATATGLAPGATYTAEVYPVSPLNPYKANGLKGEPLTVTFTTATEGCPSNGTRYEFEDYFDSTINGTTVKGTSNSSASNKKLIDADIKGTSDLTVKYTDEFEITVDQDADYEIQYAIGRAETTLASTVNIYLDDTLLGTNDNSYATDLSAGTYPGNANLMSVYKPDAVTLTSGTHTVKVEVTAAPGYTAFARYRFSLDYFQIAAVKTQEVIAKDKKTVIELDQWGSHLKGSEIRELYGASESKLLLETYGYGPFEFTIPVTIEEAGTYNIEYVVNGKKTYYGSQVDFAFETNGTIGNNSSGGTSIGYTAYSNQSLNKYTKTVDLTAGTDTLTVSIALAPSSATLSLYQLDYISFTPQGLPSEVSATETTRLELENYVGYGTLTKTDGTTSAITLQKQTHANFATGTGMLAYYTNAKADGYNYIDVDFEINAEKAGYYNLDFNASPGGTYSSYTKLYINGTNILTTSGAKLMVTNSNIVEKQYLNEGTNTVKIRINKPGTYGTFQARLDYLEFVPISSAIEVPENGTKIEMEQFKEGTLTKTDGTSSAITLKTETKSYFENNGTGIVMYYTSAKADGYNYIDFEFEIDVEKAGYYSLNLKASKGSTYQCYTRMYIDGSQVLTTGSGSGLTTQDNILAKQYLDEGIVPVKIRVLRPGTYGTFQAALDYLKIEPYSATIDIPAEGKTIEMEGFTEGTITYTHGGTAPFTLKSETNTSFATGKGLIFYYSKTQAAGYDCIDVDIELNIEKAGYYDLDLNASPGGTYQPYTRMYIDGQRVLITSSGSGLSTKSNVVEKYYFDEGKTNIKIRVSQPETYGYFQAALDYLKITPTELVYDADAEKAIANITIDTLGEAIIALYDADDKVCGVYTETITEAKMISEEIACSKVPVTCKVFVWESFETVKPLTDLRIITIE